MKSNQKSLRAEKGGAPHAQKGIAAFRKRFLRAGMAASMTVEAALVLPLFMFFFCNVLFLLDVVRLQSRVGSGGSDGGGGGGVQIPQAAGNILSAAWASGELRSHLGGDYMNHTCLRGGSGGISLLHSRILDGNGIVELNADYRTRPFIPVLSGPDFRIRSTYYGHAWTGYEGGDGAEGQAGGDSQGNEEVIVAEHGVVWHTDPGSIYHPCEYCHPSPSGKVFVTPDGNRYHSSADCSRITRTTHTETAEEAAGHLHPCPKCGHAH